MKYTVQSGKYITKNFFYIFPFAILPALFLSVSTDHDAIYCAVETLFSGQLKDFHFEHLFHAVSVLNFGSWQSVISGILGLILMVACVAMMLALIEKHFRIGKRTFNGIFSKINDNLISTCGYAFLLFAIYELWALILAALLFFASRIAFAPIAYALMAFFFLGMHVVLIYTIGLIYLWLPCMQITGFKALEALHYSYQLMAPVKWKILVGQIAFLLLTEVLVMICATFLAVGSPAFIVLTSALYALLIMLYCVRMEIAYFDRDNMERADIRSYYRF